MALKQFSEIWNYDEKFEQEHSFSSCNYFFLVHGRALFRYLHAQYENLPRRHFAFISDHQYHPLVNPYGDETGGYYYETPDNAQTTSRQGAQKLKIEKSITLSVSITYAVFVVEECELSNL